MSQTRLQTISADGGAASRRSGGGRRGRPSAVTLGSAGWEPGGWASRLIHRLLDAGCDVTVYNRTRAKAEPLAAGRGQGRGLAPPTWPAATSCSSPSAPPQDLIDAADSARRADLRRPRALGHRGRLLHCVGGRLRAGQGRTRRPGQQPARRPGHGQPEGRQRRAADLRGFRPARAFQTARPYLDMLGAGCDLRRRRRAGRTVKLCHNLFLGIVTQSLAEVDRAGARRAGSAGRRCSPASTTA